MNQITTDDLRKMNNKEGIIFMGCGGDLQDWVDGINNILTDKGILLNGSEFKNVFVFEDGKHTDMLFPFDDVDLDMGKLAVWRLDTHSIFYGTWLSDFVDNKLGGFETPESQEAGMTIG